MIIRAVVKNGKLEPLDPLPEDWTEGRMVEIMDGHVDVDSSEIERWCQEVDQAAALTPDDAEDYARLEKALADADHIAKAQMRRELRLP